MGPKNWLLIFFCQNRGWFSTFFKIHLDNGQTKHSKTLNVAGIGLDAKRVMQTLLCYLTVVKLNQNRTYFFCRVPRNNPRADPFNEVIIILLVFTNLPSTVILVAGGRWNGEPESCWRKEERNRRHEKFNFKSNSWSVSTSQTWVSVLF